MALTSAHHKYKCWQQNPFHLGRVLYSSSVPKVGKNVFVCFFFNYKNKHITVVLKALILNMYESSSGSGCGQTSSQKQKHWEPQWFHELLHGEFESTWTHGKSGCCVWEVASSPMGSIALLKSSQVWVSTFENIVPLCKLHCASHVNKMRYSFFQILESSGGHITTSEPLRLTGPTHYFN